MSFTGESFRYGWKGMIERRREFRRNPTEAEAFLWGFIRAKKLNGYQFRRQHGIGRFVVDFCNTKTRTIIEVDGKIHLQKEIQENDLSRQRELEEIGYCFLRFTNEEVLGNIDLVLTKILNHLDQSPPCQEGTVR